MNVLNIRAIFVPKAFGIREISSNIRSCTPQRGRVVSVGEVASKLQQNSFCMKQTFMEETDPSVVAVDSDGRIL